MAQAQFQIVVPKFEGKANDSLGARAYFNNIDNAIIASGCTPARMAGLVRQNLRGPALTWLDTQVILGTAGLDSWTTLRPLMVAEFAPLLTVAQLADMERELVHKADSSVSAFFISCQRYHLEEDADLTADVRAAELYKSQFDRRVRLSFLKGLRSEIRMAMSGVDLTAASNADLLKAAKNAEVLVRKPGTTSGSVASADAVFDVAHLSDEGRALLAAFERRFNRGGGRGRGGGGGRGRGGRGGGPAEGAPRRPGPSQEELRARDRAKCGTCGKWVKHRTNECFSKQDGQTSRSDGGGGSGNRGGGRGGGSSRSYAQAAGADGEPEGEFAVYSEPAENE